MAVECRGKMMGTPRKSSLGGGCVVRVAHRMHGGKCCSGWGMNVVVVVDLMRPSHGRRLGLDTVIWHGGGDAGKDCYLGGTRGGEGRSLDRSLLTQQMGTFVNEKGVDVQG